MWNPPSSFSLHSEAQVSNWRNKKTNMLRLEGTLTRWALYLELVMAKWWDVPVKSTTYSLLSRSAASAQAVLLAWVRFIRWYMSQSSHPVYRFSEILLKPSQRTTRHSLRNTNQHGCFPLCLYLYFLHVVFVLASTQWQLVWCNWSECATLWQEALTNTFVVCLSV